jgi:hypothetical protein
MKFTSAQPRTDALYRRLYDALESGPQRWIDALVEMTQLAADLESGGDAAQYHEARSEDFKRRVRVEQYLYDAAAGKAPLPDAAKCRELAVVLGVPDEFRIK